MSTPSGDRWSAKKQQRPASACGPAGEKRSAPNEVERLIEADTADILLRIDRRRIELGGAEIHFIAVQIADCQMGLRERGSEHSTDPSVPGWQVEGRRRFDVARRR